ncbi:TetR/AcrR family transcriptional regulator [Nonomuraea sp. NBC_01738]|uniref:TetR/AcrR family transcriptional regulator n=1 Tax=Nonomuraea sp. NBC_01738 TaxID=2976003 RepID=UPI002E1170BF|nr:TetR/AcrR family transcriptional regulator [Nonomuraea sp. NBC_01738]
MSEGLRERKKRQTRRHIAAVATGLFVERGFDHVTIAEVAEAAEVSVNTVYNYFQTKEDLVLPPDEASPMRLALIVRERPAGLTPARAVLEHLRAEVRRRDRAVGLTDGFPRVLEMMRAAPTLTARLNDLGRAMTKELAKELAREAGGVAEAAEVGLSGGGESSGAGDLVVGGAGADVGTAWRSAAEEAAGAEGTAGLLGELVAWQLGSVHALVYGEIGERVSAGQQPEEIAAAVLRLLDGVEEVLGERVLTFGGVK